MIVCLSVLVSFKHKTGFRICVCRFSCPVCFFFQAEDGIRDHCVTGVQTCALPISRFLDKYKQHLAPSESGPYIATAELLTPFARLVMLSSERTMGYSAQQAAEEHRGEAESVAINIEVLLTDSYGPLIARPTGPRSGSPIGYAFRSPEFWKDIQVQVMVEDRILKPARFTGEPTYVCASEGGCTLSGATMRLEFPARVFTSNSATVQVSPPDGPEVFVDFDLTALR